MNASVQTIYNEECKGKVIGEVANLVARVTDRLLAQHSRALDSKNARIAELEQKVADSTMSTAFTQVCRVLDRQGLGRTTASNANQVAEPICTQRDNALRELHGLRCRIQTALNT